MQTNFSEQGCTCARVSSAIGDGYDSGVEAEGHTGTGSLDEFGPYVGHPGLRRLRFLEHRS